MRQGKYISSSLQHIVGFQESLVSFSLRHSTHFSVCASYHQEDVFPQDAYSSFLLLGTRRTSFFMYRIHTQPREKYELHLTCRKTHNLLQYEVLPHPNIKYVQIEINRKFPHYKSEGQSEFLVSG